MTPTNSAMTGAAKARKYVLSIDGSGFRGFACLVTLHHLMRELTADPDVDPVPLPCEVFDLICGTSTGGLIAVLLGRFGLDCMKAMSIYKELGTSLFGAVGGKGWDSIVEAGGLSPNAFEEKLASIVKKYTGEEDTPMRVRKASPDKVVHKSTETFVTAVHSAAGAAGSEPYRLRSYTTPPDGVDSLPDHDWTIFQVVRAATALPTYLKPFSVGSQPFQDAATSGAANPVREALSEVTLRWSNKVEPVIVSLGTGLVSLFPVNSSREEEPSERHRPIFNKLLKVLKLKTQKTKTWSDEFAKQLVRVAQDTELVHQDAMKLFIQRRLPDNYFRFNPTAGLGDIDISDVTQIPKILALTNVWLVSPEGSGQTLRACEALKVNAIAPFLTIQMRC
ncbi:acyl transferase/acyl hydrolase/lysophospholipase [Hygrophoropsis aurantiaca]|uniref:Acyl transferase/acyl hydrolase/lysophospholipase n=1 Tax=Hygrophoropsis aurantiaca TaxID=72124 RepID=A0ACB8A2K5_9AGAM|nr:acyl transferase/acyl hydrolase/lysophospholipase [Hygrophoropsis aurantiaca]